jgi:uncharacterized membrane protein YfcA
MAITVLLTLFGVGVLVGVISGLVGIGGGVLIVPFLYFFYGHPGWSGTSLPPDLLTTVAHATSLFIIVPTAIRGVLVYHRAGAVVWDAAFPIAIAAILAAIAGARLALYLPAAVLKVAFGLLLLASAIQMGWGYGKGAGRRVRRVTLPRTAITGIAVGLLSAMLGVGGGVIAIPMLAYLIGLEVRQLAATSLAIIMFAALAGTITYMLSSEGTAGLPLGYLGHVHLLAALPILAGSLLAVGWGTRLNQRLPARKLRWIFAVLFGGVGIQLLVENIKALS